MKEKTVRLQNGSIRIPLPNKTEKAHKDHSKYSRKAKHNKKTAEATAPAVSIYSTTLLHKRQFCSATQNVFHYPIAGMLIY